MQPALAIAMALLLCAGAAQATSAAMTSELVQNQRRLLVLAEAPPQIRGEARRAGHYLFVRNQQLMRDLVHEVRSGASGTVASRYQDFTRAADLAVHAEGDQLVLRGLLRGLSAPGVLSAADRYDAQRRLSAIGDVRRRFGAALDEGDEGALKSA